MGVPVVIVDSGVKCSHPHVRDGDVVMGPTILEDGRVVMDELQVDHLGHGTAVAAAILDLAPRAVIHSIKVFEQHPTCSFGNILTALRMALEIQPAIVNLSIGTSQVQHMEALEDVLVLYRERGVRLVAPASFEGLPSYPGVMQGVDGVVADGNISRASPEKRVVDERELWFSSPYPRDLPGIPREVNLHGGSMASANVTGYLAARLEEPAA